MTGGSTNICPATLIEFSCLKVYQPNPPHKKKENKSDRKRQKTSGLFTRRHSLFRQEEDKMEKECSLTGETQRILFAIKKKFSSSKFAMSNTNI